MLCGYPPFNGKNDDAVLTKILKGNFSFEGKEWATVSSDAKGLIMKMLTKNISRRPSAIEVFNDPWIQDHKFSKANKITVKTLKNLRRFRSSRKLKQAVLEFIASQLISTQETKCLREVFVSLDKNGDGKLSLEELKEGYNIAKIDLPDIETFLECFDADGNEFIEYSEFITATINWKKQLSNEKIESVFKLFDADGSGKIGIDEINSIFGNDALIHNDVWADFIKEADKNGDGEIDMYEFKALMLEKL